MHRRIINKDANEVYTVLAGEFFCKTWKVDNDGWTVIICNHTRRFTHHYFCDNIREVVKLVLSYIKPKEKGNKK